jgi:hypothetical protein
VLAAAEAGAAAGESALTARVESFTVRLDHSVPVRLRCGSEPYLIIHSAARPYRYMALAQTHPHTTAHAH